MIKKFLSIMLTMSVLFMITPILGMTADSEEIFDENAVMPTALTAAESFAGGTGSEDSPYEIATAEQLKKLADDSSLWSNHFKLTTNINLQNEEWTPIGNSSTKFTGTFDGGGCKISGLYINSSGEYKGLFGYISNAKIQNLIVEGSITGSSTTNSRYIGGIVGYNDGGTIDNCGVNVEVTSGSYYVGGIVGFNGTGSTISNCYNMGDVIGSSGRVGGITGSNRGTIQKCYNSGEITSNNKNYGGIAGEQEGGTIQNCYNIGHVVCTSYGYGGGIVGNNDYNSTIQNCYNIGYVEGEGETTAYMGGIAGSGGSYNATNCYYLYGNLKGSSTSSCGTSKKEDAFKSGEVSYLLQNGRDDLVWGQALTVDAYPKLTSMESERVLKVEFFINSGDRSTFAVGYANPNGAVAEFPVAPSHEGGLLFYKWTTDGTLGGAELNSATPITADGTKVYATWQQPTPDDIETKTTESSITVTKPVSDNDEYEYAIDNGNWQDNPVFDGLTPNSKHTVHVRRKGDDNILPSESKDIEVTLGKQQQEAPDNVETEVTDSTITVTYPISDDDEYEYAIDDGDWGDSPEFTGLEPGSEHTVHVRRKETDTHNPSGRTSVTATTTQQGNSGSGTPVIPSVPSSGTSNTPSGGNEPSTGDSNVPSTPLSGGNEPSTGDSNLPSTPPTGDMTDPFDPLPGDTDNDSDTITIDTDKFSTYSIADQNTELSNPDTGKTTSIVIIGLACVVIMAAVTVRKRK